LIYLTAQSFSIGTYTVVIGSGGQGILGSSTVASGINGDDSYIQRSGTDIYRAKGGGGGGKGYPTPAQAGNGDLGISGGSSGGTGGGNTNLANAVVTNNVPVGSYGNRGGSGSDGSVVFSSAFAGGGGGGSGSVGGNATINKGQDSAGGGGTGTTINIYGNNVTYAAGGGGGVASSSSGTSGSGGSSIGGNGSKGSTAASIGLAGTGSGGGGGGWDASNNNRANSGAGGSGIVIIRYTASQFATTSSEEYGMKRWNDSTSYLTGSKFISYTDGNVGIGVTSPVTKLHVGAGNYATGTTNLRYFDYATAITAASYALPDTAAVFESSIWVKSFVGSSSDKRIKKNIVDIDDDSALQKIRAIQPKTYNYIDSARGTEKVYGFIAQQIKEVIPEAVTTQKELIPNIFSTAECVANIIKFPSSILVNKSIVASKINLIDLYGKRDTYNIIDVDTESNSVTIDNELVGDQVFVYGTEVNDFHTLDKSYIYTLNVCATQILSDKVNDLYGIIGNLTNRLQMMEHSNGTISTDSASSQTETTPETAPETTQETSTDTAPETTPETAQATTSTETTQETSTETAP
jgi:hypothetical protein